MRLAVKVIPGAKTDGIAGWLGDALKVRVRAHAEKGKANKAVIKLLAAELGIPDSQIQIISGLTNPNKVLEIAADQLDLSAINQT